jgi:hypothetical protein
MQLLAVVLLWTLTSTVGVRGGASWRRLLGLWGGSQAAVPRYVTPVATHTSDLTQWAAAPGSFSFTTPQSRCTLHHNSELPWSRLCCWRGATPSFSSKPFSCCC